MRNVIFDLGGVVLEWNPDRILESFYDDAALRATLKTTMFQHPDWLDMDRGVLTEADVVRRLEERCGRDPAELFRLLEAVRHSLVPKPETVALLDRLARRAVPLYCLSNMPATTFAFLRDRYEFWPVFRGIVISGEIRLMKPDPDIFEHLLRLYDLDATRTIFVDDLAANVAAARSVGLQAVWFRDAEQCERDLEALLAPP